MFEQYLATFSYYYPKIKYKSEYRAFGKTYGLKIVNIINIIAVDVRRIYNATYIELLKCLV